MKRIRVGLVRVGLGGAVALLVGLATEQAKAVLDFPLDARRAGGGRLGPRGIAAAACDEEEEGEEKNRAHGVCRNRPRP